MQPVLYTTHHSVPSDIHISHINKTVLYKHYRVKYQPTHDTKQEDLKLFKFS